MLFGVDDQLFFDSIWVMINIALLLALFAIAGFVIVKLVQFLKRNSH